MDWDDILQHESAFAATLFKSNLAITFINAKCEFVCTSLYAEYNNVDDQRLNVRKYIV